MRDLMMRTLILEVLRPNPDFSRLQELGLCGARRRARLLRWLDQSGLALHFLWQLRRHVAMARLPEEFCEALERRWSANRDRTQDMFAEFRRITTALQDRGVRFCVLKGFSLTPDFCRAPHLRHQTDLDFLVAPESLQRAKQVLAGFGYQQRVSDGGNEVVFATPLGHIPTAEDDIYARPQHREVDLVTSLRGNAHGVAWAVSSDCLSRGGIRTLDGVSFPALAPDDAFSQQIMHAFTHFLGSWVRTSWLLEIGDFIDLHFADANLWQSIVARAGNDRTQREAFGLILSLTNTVFPRPIPRILDDWCLKPLPNRITAWTRQFGIRMAVCDLDGTKLTLFVHGDFLENPGSWFSYLASRILPTGQPYSIGKIATEDPGVRIKARAAQCVHVVRRLTFHARSLVSLPTDLLRWKLALRAAQGRCHASPAQPNTAVLERL
jgi:hypothetical protein